MASPRTSVSSFLGTAALESLRAENAELRRLVLDLSSRVERLEASSPRLGCEGSSSKAHCAKLAARGHLSAKAGRAIGDAPNVPSRAGLSKAKKPDEWKVVSIRGDRGLVLRKQGVEEASAKSLPVSNRFAVLSEDDPEDIAPAASSDSSVVAEPEEGEGGNVFVRKL